jgi:hypothetical protein
MRASLASAIINTLLGILLAASIRGLSQRRFTSTTQLAASTG